MNNLGDLSQAVASLLTGPVGLAIMGSMFIVMIMSVPSAVKRQLDKLEKEPHETYWSEKHQNKLALWRGLYGLSLFLFRFLPGVFAWGLLKAMG